MMNNKVENEDNQMDVEEKEIQESNQKNEQNQIEEKNQEGQMDKINNEDPDDVESELMYIYEWVDSIELSRPKKNIARDFSDGVLLAEILKNYFPRLVDLHNYPSCSNSKHKESNWNVLNNKVLKKIGIKLTKNAISDIIHCQHLAIENLLQKVYTVLQINGVMNKTQKKSNFNLQENNSNILRKNLEEKENTIKQLHDIVEVLEFKLKNSEEMEKILENKVQQLTDLLNKNGVNPEN